MKNRTRLLNPLRSSSTSGSLLVKASIPDAGPMTCPLLTSVGTRDRSWCQGRGERGGANEPQSRDQAGPQCRSSPPHRLPRSFFRYNDSTPGTPRVAQLIIILGQRRQESILQDLIRKQVFHCLSHCTLIYKMNWSILLPCFALQ